MTVNERAKTILAEFPAGASHWVAGKNIKRRWFLEAVTVRTVFVSEMTEEDKKAWRKPFTLEGIPVLEDEFAEPDSLMLVYALRTFAEEVARQKVELLEDYLRKEKKR